MANEKIQVNPDVIRWAFRRIGGRIERKLQKEKDPPKWFVDAEEWLGGDKQPTFKQLLKFAQISNIPIDYLLSDTPPPPAKVPLPDMRTIGNREIKEPSLELLEKIHLCQWRQEWYKNYLRHVSSKSCDFVKSVSKNESEYEVAYKIRRRLKLRTIRREDTWEGRVKSLINATEALGVLVMRDSMVRSSERMLDAKEFRGFAIADEQAPVIFINGADHKGAQAFTLAHELAHLWIGQTALSGSRRFTEGKPVEKWCNLVAAELLVPASSVQENFNNKASVSGEVNRLSNNYKVSKLVILIRLKTLRLIDQQSFQEEYDLQIAKGVSRGGGNRESRFIYHLNRVGKIFPRAVISSVVEGSITLKEAYEMLEISNVRALNDMSDRIGLGVPF